jgi:hypothetical protein
VNEPFTLHQKISTIVSRFLSWPDLKTKSSDFINQIPPSNWSSN